MRISVLGNKGKGADFPVCGLERFVSGHPKRAYQVNPAAKQGVFDWQSYDYITLNAL